MSSLSFLIVFRSCYFFFFVSLANVWLILSLQNIGISFADNLYSFLLFSIYFSSSLLFLLMFSLVCSFSSYLRFKVILFFLFCFCFFFPLSLSLFYFAASQHFFRGGICFYFYLFQYIYETSFLISSGVCYLISPCLKT